MPFGLIVGIYFFEGVVQYLGKLLQAIRHPGKLNQPLVAAFGVLVHKDRSRGIVYDLRSGGCTGFVQAFLGILHNQLFAKSVDEVLRAAGNDKFVGAVAGELHCVPDHITP